MNEEVPDRLREKKIYRTIWGREELIGHILLRVSWERKDEEKGLD